MLYFEKHFETQLEERNLTKFKSLKLWNQIQTVIYSLMFLFKLNKVEKKSKLVPINNSIILHNDNWARGFDYLDVIWFLYNIILMENKTVPVDYTWYCKFKKNLCLDHC